MLPKKNRLTSNEDFKNTYLSGSFFSFGEISIKFSQNNLAESRIGLAVGKKYSKLAVERNHAKRILRSALNDFVKNIKPGFDIIVIIKKSTATALTKDTILNRLEKIFKKTNLLK